MQGRITIRRSVAVVGANFQDLHIVRTRVLDCKSEGLAALDAIPMVAA